MTRSSVLSLAAACIVVARPVASQQTVPPYRDRAQSVDARVRDLLGRMSLEEKFWQLYMSPGSRDNPAHDYSHGTFGLQVGVRADAEAEDSPRGKRTARDLTRAGELARQHARRINAIQHYLVDSTRLGIPMFPFEEALHGLKAEGATVFPQAIALAASWDTALMGRVATAVAREAGSRGIRDVLSPVVNIASDVRWGRVEETYGEDPWLTTLMGRAFVAPFEQRGIVTTPKHFVANVGDGGRDSYPIEVTERRLDEIFFPPFKELVDRGAGGARSIMTAYNSVDGSPATQSRWLLTDKLRREWGFRGFVISDAAATGGSTVLHFTEPNTPTAAKDAWEAGLDVVFQSTWEQHRPYLDAVQRGLVGVPTLDSAVARVLRAKFETGLFERPYVDPDSAAYWAANPAHVALAREAARAGIVLLRNERNALPFGPGVRTIAVIGEDADEARLGGYTAPNAGAVSVLAALRERLGASRVRHAPGVRRLERDHVVVPSERLTRLMDFRPQPGVKGEYFDNNSLSGEPRLTRTDARIDFGWTLNSPGRGIPFDWYSVRWTTRITAPPGGVARLGVEGNDGYRLWVDDRLVIDNWRKVSYRSTLVPVTFAAGSVHDIRLEYFESTGNARVKLIWDAGVRSVTRQAIDSAVTLARRSDVAIVVAGIEEGEFRDRAFLSLPGAQEELIQRVAATGKPTVVVLVGGSAITMSRWIDRTAAVLDAWYPGEQGGHAVADVLFGDYNPAGRLPVTFPISEGQLPLVYNHKPTGRGDDYLDLTGQPLLPFGYGLSYTTFEYSSLAIEPQSIGPSDRAVVRARVKNTGARAGDEVVQLYIRDVLASVARPMMQLAGFQRVHLNPGEEAEVHFTLGPAQLGMLDRDRRWVVEPGVFRVMVGASSKDVRLRGEMQVR